MVFGLETLSGKIARGTHFFKNNKVIFATDRGTQVDQVGYLQPQAVDFLGFGIGFLLGGLDLGGQRGCFLHQLINLLLQLWAGVLFQLPLQRADFLA